MRPVLLVLLLLARAVPERASAAPVCGPEKAKTLAAGKLTRAYVSRKDGPVYACTRGFKPWRHLGETYC